MLLPFFINFIVKLYFLILTRKELKESPTTGLNCIPPVGVVDPDCLPDISTFLAFAIVSFTASDFTC